MRNRSKPDGCYGASFMQLQELWNRKKKEHKWENPETQFFLNKVSQSELDVKPFPFEETIGPESKVISLDSPVSKKKTKKSVSRLKKIGSDDSEDSESELDEMRGLLERPLSPVSSQVKEVSTEVSLKYDKNGVIIIDDDDDDDDDDGVGVGGCGGGNNGEDESFSNGGGGLRTKTLVDDDDISIIELDDQALDGGLHVMEASQCDSMFDESWSDADDDDNNNNNDKSTLPACSKDLETEGNAEDWLEREGHLCNKVWKGIHRRRSRMSFVFDDDTNFSPILVPDDKDTNANTFDDPSKKSTKSSPAKSNDNDWLSSAIDIVSDNDDSGKSLSDEYNSVSSDSDSSCCDDDDDDDEMDDDSFIVPDDAPIEYYDKTIDDRLEEVKSKIVETARKKKAIRASTSTTGSGNSSSNSRKEKRNAKQKSARKVVSFKQEREAIAEALLKECNKVIFDNRFKSSELSIEWSNALRTTAGQCRCSGSLEDGSAHATIRISTKVCDRYRRLKSTLVHEMCHAAVFLLDRAPSAQPHGTLFRKWGALALERYGVRVTTTHKYAINYKHQYVCTKCSNRYGTNTLNDEPRCHYCGSALVPAKRRR